MRSADEFNNVQRLVAAGMNDCAIARLTGIPRRTVRDLRCRPGVRPRNKPVSSDCGIAHDLRLAGVSLRFSILPPPAPYCYLLGLYLGDGCISRGTRTLSLRITLDAKYPAVIERCRQAIDILMPTQRAGVLRRSDGCTDVYMYSKHWPCLFPQHGPGKKHDRRIALEPWQQALVDQATEEFVLGLIHSDGCRVVANDRGVMNDTFRTLEDIIACSGHREARRVCRRVTLLQALSLVSCRSTARG